MKYILLLLCAITLPDLSLIQVGRDLNIKSIATGVQNNVLQNTAERQAAYQAKIHVQGHQNWNSRVQELYRDLPDCDSFAEVCNESWPGQDQESAAYEMYRSWKLSPRHWKAVDGKCTYYGYAMIRGSNNIWYAVGVFGYKRNNGNR